MQFYGQLVAYGIKHTLVEYIWSKKNKVYNNHRVTLEEYNVSYYYKSLDTYVTKQVMYKVSDKDLLHVNIYHYNLLLPRHDVR